MRAAAVSAIPVEGPITRMFTGIAGFSLKSRHDGLHVVERPGSAGPEQAR